MARQRIESSCPPRRSAAAGHGFAKYLESEVKISLWLIGLMLVAGAVHGHTHLKSSTPAEGSVLAMAPENIVLKFSEATRVTALTLQKEGAEEQKLAPLPSAAAQEVNIPAPKLAPGRYVVTWRGMGSDNHIMSGK